MTIIFHFSGTKYKQNVLAKHNDVTKLKGWTDIKVYKQNLERRSFTIQSNCNKHSTIIQKEVKK